MCSSFFKQTQISFSPFLSLASSLETFCSSLRYFQSIIFSVLTLLFPVIIKNAREILFQRVQHSSHFLTAFFFLICYSNSHYLSSLLYYFSLGKETFFIGYLFRSPSVVVCPRLCSTWLFCFFNCFPSDVNQLFMHFCTQSAWSKEKTSILVLNSSCTAAVPPQRALKLE